MFLFNVLLCAQFSILTIISATTSAPEIGVYQMNFKYEKVKVFSEIPNSKVTLPLLKRSYYTENTIQLICKAEYPVQWVYSGFGYPQVRATTSRLSSNDLGEEFSKIFEARVVFSFTEASQSGNYSCESISSPEIRTYVDISIAGENGITVDYVNPGKISQPSNESLRALQISLRGANTIRCCSNSGAQEFPILTYNTCESVSDCGIRINYLENKPRCKGRACLRGQLKTIQKTENGKNCSIRESVSESGGVVQCSATGSGNEYLMFTKSEKGNTLIEDFHSPPSTKEILTIFVEPVGQADLFISCAPNWFFFSHGIKLAVQSQPGNTLKFINDDRNSIRVKKDDFMGKTVFCLAPVWNSAEWRNVSTVVS